MSHNPQQILKDLQPTKNFFIGIDSDGCVFDTMEIKQKECFCPNLIQYFELQSVSKYARETWEFVNLYSKTRGVNRFPALLKFMELLAERPEVNARSVSLMDMKPLADWIKKESQLGNPALERYAKEVNDPVISQVLNWSLQVNKTIEDMVYGISPFPLVKESLHKMIETADTMVVSQTPVEALEREWKENNIDQFVRVIAGQEYGTKTEHLAMAATGKYSKDKILMIGDAPGDLKAALANDVLFYPINPGHEEDSWKRFHDEAINKFFNGTFSGNYQTEIIDEFEAYLPEKPRWNK